MTQNVAVGYGGQMDGAKTIAWSGWNDIGFFDAVLAQSRYDSDGF